MTVTQPLTGWGEWSIDLDESTPSSVLRAANPWDHRGALVRIYAGEVTAGQLDTIMPLWSGPVLRQAGQGRSLSGPGPTWFLGDWDPSRTIWNADRDGHGAVTVSPITLTNGTLTDWITAVLSSTQCGFVPGTITGPATLRSGTITGYTARTILESYVRARWGVRFRANPDYTLDVGTLANLYPQSTIPVATRRGGRGATKAGLIVETLDLEVDATNMTTETIVYRGVGGSFVSAPGSSGWVNPQGDPLLWRRLASMDDATVDEASEYANELQADSVVTRTASLSTVDYDLGGTVRPGELVDIYDPASGFFDPTVTPRPFRGDVIQPVRLRVHESTWPVTSGMGVWLDRRHLPAGDAIDLTRYVVWDDNAATTYQVGAPPARIGASVRL